MDTCGEHNPLSVNPIPELLGEGEVPASSLWLCTTTVQMGRRLWWSGDLRKQSSHSISSPVEAPCLSMQFKWSQATWRGFPLLGPWAWLLAESSDNSLEILPLGRKKTEMGTSVLRFQHQYFKTDWPASAWATATTLGSLNNRWDESIIMKKQNTLHSWLQAAASSESLYLQHSGAQSLGAGRH